MDNKQKLQLLEELMELDEGTLSEDMELNKIDEYDSMTKLSLIVMVEDEFGKKLSADEVKSFVTIGDIIRIME